MSGGGSNTSLVFYARSYHPIQSGSIDGTDILPHDNAVYRALLCSSAGLYDPFGDPKVIGDPYCTLFVGHLSRLTDEESLRKAMGKYGRVKTLRLVRHIVTGASCGYAFVEYETEREMRRAYEDAHHSFIDDSEIIVEYNRQQLMPGWIPRRLGGGLGGRKESGQLRFGGRDRPFRAPLRPIPWDDLNRLGIPPPPEGHYMRRNQIPSPPRRRRPDVEEDLPSKRTRTEHMKEVSPRKKRRSSYEEEPLSRKRKGSTDRDATSSRHQRHQSEHSGNDGSRKHRRRQSEHSGDDGSRRHRRHHSGHSGDDSFSKHHRHQSEHSGDDRTSRHHRHQTHHADQSKITTVSREGS